MAIDIKKSDALVAKEKAGISAIAAKYGDTSYKPVTPAAVGGVVPHEPSMFERTLDVEAKQEAKPVISPEQNEAADAVAAVIAAMDGPPVVQDEPEAKVVVTPKTEEKPVIEQPKSDETAKQVAALVARVTELSDKLAGYEKAARTEKAAETKPQGKVVISEEEWNRDPIAAMAKFKGWTEERMAQHLLYKTKPDQLDAKMTANVMNDRTNGELLAVVGELRAEIASLKDERKQERYSESIEKSVAGIEDSKYPLLSTLRKKNPAAADKRIKRAVGTGNPDAADVLTAVEAELKDEGYESGPAQSNKEAVEQESKNDDAPALTAATARGSFAKPGQTLTWAERDAQNRALLKSKYEKRV